MLYIERLNQQNGHYDYEVEDVFGKLSLESQKRLNGDELDQITTFLVHRKGAAPVHETGVIHLEQDTANAIKFTFTRVPLWQNDTEPSLWKNTLMSIKKQVNAFIAQYQLKTRVISWLQPYAEVSRKAWQKIAKQK